MKDCKLKINKISNRKKGKSLNLPIFDFLISKINNENFKLGKLKSKSDKVNQNRKERLLFLCWFIEDMRYYSEDDPIRIHTNYWNSIQNMKSKKKFTDCLEDNKIIFITKYKVGEYSKGHVFLFSDFKTSNYQFKKISILEHYDNYIKYKEQSFENEVEIIVTEKYPDNKESILALTNNIKSNLSFDTDRFCKFIEGNDIDESLYLNDCMRIIKNNFSIKYAHGRIYHTFCSIPKLLRPFLIDNKDPEEKEWCEYDASNMLPIIIGMNLIEDNNKYLKKEAKLKKKYIDKTRIASNTKIEIIESDEERIQIELKVDSDEIKSSFKTYAEVTGYQYNSKLKEDENGLKQDIDIEYNQRRFPFENHKFELKDTLLWMELSESGEIYKVFKDDLRQVLLEIGYGEEYHKAWVKKRFMDTLLFTKNELKWFLRDSKSLFNLNRDILLIYMKHKFPRVRTYIYNQKVGNEGNKKFSHRTFEQEGDLMFNEIIPKCVEKGIGTFYTIHDSIHFKKKDEQIVRDAIGSALLKKGKSGLPSPTFKFDKVTPDIALESKIKKDEFKEIESSLKKKIKKVKFAKIIRKFKKEIKKIETAEEYYERRSRENKMKYDSQANEFLNLNK